jgi:hypothetical protein
MIKLKELLKEVSVEDSIQRIKEMIKSLPSNSNLKDVGNAINKNPKNFKYGFGDGGVSMNTDFEDDFYAHPFNFKQKLQKSLGDVPKAWINFITYPRHQPVYLIMAIDTPIQKKAVEWEMKNNPRYKGYKFEKLNSKLYGYATP